MHVPTIWIDHYGRFLDAFDHIFLSARQIQYILGQGDHARPHFQLPVVINV